MRRLGDLGTWLVIVGMAAFGSLLLWLGKPIDEPIMCFVGAAFGAGMQVGFRLARPVISEATALAEEATELAKEQAVEIGALRRRRGFHVER